nr:MFS-type transporter clz9-like [Hydra vulgaris]
MGFNKVAVNKFFELVKNVIDINKIDVERVWNVDETGISTLPKSLSKVISTKGKRQVGSLTYAERGQLVTAVICCSASGRYMPPILIFPRQRMKAELMDGAPPGAYHPSGWIQTDLFINWLKKFILHTGDTKDSPVLLILDGHATHTKSIELIDIARENGVILLCLPPHCTHKMQPLDISFMKPLSTFYDHNLRKWLRTNPGRVVTQFQIASLFEASYLDAATMTNAINGFKKAGIW